MSEDEAVKGDILSHLLALDMKHIACNTNASPFDNVLLYIVWFLHVLILIPALLSDAIALIKGMGKGDFRVGHARDVPSLLWFLSIEYCSGIYQLFANRGCSSSLQVVLFHNLTLGMW